MCSMKLNRYWIEKIDYSLDIDLYENRNKEINIVPELKREVFDIDENNAVVKLSLVVKKTNVVPFFINIIVCGLFESSSWKESEDGQYFINTTSAQVLFPYLRQAVSTITGLSNISQYVLPIVNVNNLFNKDNK